MYLAFLTSTFAISNQISEDRFISVLLLMLPFINVANNHLYSPSNESILNILNIEYIDSTYTNYRI